MDLAEKGEIMSNHFWKYYKKEIEDNKKFFDEDTARFYFKQIIQGLRYRNLYCFNF